mgnify:FL=1
MYANGRGAAQNDKEAVAWYRKAAEQGHANAQNNLGVMYANGQGVSQNDKEAVTWYRKAAEQGNANAQKNLGVRYEDGRGTAQNYKEAVAWYRKAAEQANADAQNYLGGMYANALGVPQSKVIAYSLYNLSYANDSSERNNAGNNRNALANNMTAKELEAGQALTASLAKPGMFLKVLEAAEKSLLKASVDSKFKL